MATTPDKLLSRIRQAFKQLKVRPLPPRATKLFEWGSYGELKAADPLAALAAYEGKIVVKIGNVGNQRLIENQIGFVASDWAREKLGNEFVSGFNDGYDDGVAPSHPDAEYLGGRAAGEFVATKLIPTAPKSVRVTASLRGRSLEF